MGIFNFPVMLNYFQSVDTNFQSVDTISNTGELPFLHIVAITWHLTFANLEGMIWNLTRFLFRFFIHLCLSHISFCVQCMLGHVFWVIHANSLYLLDIKLLLVLYIFFHIVVCAFSFSLWYLLMTEFLDFIFNLILWFLLC